MWIFSWISKALGLSRFAGTATFVAGLLIIISAAAAWIRDDAVNDCNVAWELKLVKEQEKLKNELAARGLKLKELEEKLLLALQREEQVTGENSKLLEKQRERIPLSEACNACRVPNERLWVRPAGAPSRSQSGPGS